VGLAAGGDVEGVGEQREDGLEALACTALAAGEIDDEGCAAETGDGAGEPGEAVLLRALGAHGLGQAGDFAVDDAEGGFGGAVAGAARFSRAAAMAGSSSGRIWVRSSASGHWARSRAATAGPAVSTMRPWEQRSEMVSTARSIRRL